MATGKVAVITAGGSGMGAAAATRLAADGFHVGILSSSGKGAALAGQLGGVGVTGSNQSVQEDWHRGMDVYLMNVIRPTRLVTPIMQQQRCGTIINISTAWAFEPSAGFPTSAVFRAGLATFTKIFADTYAQDNIRMNNVLPGWIDSLPATQERRMSVPLQRYGTSEEIAATIAFLASDGAAYITAQNIRVDGALTRSV
jgi:NAD(P)-dependent dehydrogenase (short-subunit alcohol dehydrogenase family)